MIFNKIKDLKKEGKRVGIVFSSFDLLHAGGNKYRRGSSLCQKEQQKKNS